MIAVRKPDFSMELRAFVTPRSEESQVDLEKIKKYLRTQLPSWRCQILFFCGDGNPKNRHR